MDISVGVAMWVRVPGHGGKGVQDLSHREVFEVYQCMCTVYIYWSCGIAARIPAQKASMPSPGY